MIDAYGMTMAHYARKWWQLFTTHVPAGALFNGSAQCRASTVDRGSISASERGEIPPNAFQLYSMLWFDVDGASLTAGDLG